MALWVDKYRPTQLDKLDYHGDISTKLKNLAANGDFPHLLFYGPSGAGKKTRIMCLLRELFGPGVSKMKIEHKTYKTPSDRKVEISTIASNFHIEVNPSDAGIHDYTVVREMLKEVAQSHVMDLGQARGFKVVVISEADKLTKDAQHALRRIMEKYMSNCRYILCCNSSSKVIGAIRSRCLGVRVAAPTIDDIVSTLNTVAKKEHIGLPPELATRIAARSNRNLRRAILMLEAAKVQGGAHLRPDQHVPMADWEEYLHETAKRILEEQSPPRLLEVRGRLYELITHCIPAGVIIKGLVAALIKSLDEQQKIDVAALAAEYEHRMQKGSKVIFHLEAFVAKFMSIYKSYLLDLEQGLM
mmetsp:Transcript_15236/g.39170  ORF Transcript_15236/g.39170 Transcript_15236/m.39170 type:complete len:357 (+) Transcript_15236:44-1114(+)